MFSQSYLIWISKLYSTHKFWSYSICWYTILKSWTILLSDRILNLCRLQFVHKGRPWPKVDSDRNHWQKTEFSKTKNKVYSWRGPPWTMMGSSVELVYRPQWSHPWTSSMNDNEEWTIQSSIQRTDEQTTLGKTRHDRAVNKPMTVAQSSWSSWSPSAVSSRWGSYLRTHRLPRTLGKLLRK